MSKEKVFTLVVDVCCGALWTVMTIINIRRGTLLSLSGTVEAVAAVAFVGSAVYEWLKLRRSDEEKAQD